MKTPEEDMRYRMPTVSGPSSGPAGPFCPPEIKGYEILKVLGEGGMGVVYLARQKQPIQRQVALKVVKPGMDSKRVLARFAAERQALALLDHPNIAQVYDAGAAESGLPYFAMEYVSGLPITKYCDRQRLGIEERLRLFIQVCEGVQHAHQKGIIHRDLKPSNVLISTEDDKPLPKIIDFGVAKALFAPLSDQTCSTEQGLLLGTPEYMSPEQAHLTAGDVDTRSDIYSLGVLLYELLIGTMPFEPDALREGGLEHTRRVICHEEPKTPSMRLSALPAGALKNIASLRHTDIRVLRRQLRDDLNWITLKAMEKDRVRRYNSAGELIADIERHISHEPVVAGPPNKSYCLKKFIRRHRHFVAGAAIVAVSLTLGFLVSTILYLRAEQAREREANAHAVADAVAQYLTNDVLGLVAPERAGSREVSVQALLDKASKNLEGKFEGQPLVEAEIRQTLGETYRQLGEYASSEPHLERAYGIRRQLYGEVHPSTLTSMSQLGRLYFLQARYGEAEPLLSRAFEMRSLVLRPDDPNMLESKVRLAMLYSYHTPWINRDKMLRLLTEAFETGGHVLGDDHLITLEARYGLAMWYALNRSVEGIGPCEEGYSIASRTFGQRHPLTVQFMSCLAIFRSWKARYVEAEDLATKAYDISSAMLGEDHPITLQCTWTLSFVYSCQFRLAGAEKLLKEVVPLSRRLLGDKHFWTLCYLRHLALLRIKQGHFEDARNLLSEALEARRRTPREEHGWVHEAMSWLMKLYAMQGKGEELKDWCSGEIERLDALPGDNSNAMAHIHSMLSRIQACYPAPEIRNATEAIENAAEACRLTNRRDWRCMDSLAAAHAEAGEFDSAVRLQKEAVDLAATGPSISALEAFLLLRRLELYRSHRPYREGLLSLDGSCLYAEGDYEGAEVALTKAREHSERVLGAHHPETRGCIIALIELYESSGDLEEAEQCRRWLARTEVVRR